MSNNINKLGIGIAVLGVPIKYNSKVKPMGGRLSILTMLAMSEYLGLKELYEFSNEVFAVDTGFRVSSHLELMRDLDKAPHWYATAVRGLSGIASERIVLNELVEEGFSNPAISHLTAKSRAKALDAVVSNDLWGEYMKNHHTRKSRTNPRDNEELMKLASLGLSQKEMGDYLGITKQGVSDLFKRRPTVYEVWRKVKGKI